MIILGVDFFFLIVSVCVCVSLAGYLGFIEGRLRMQSTPAVLERADLLEEYLDFLRVSPPVFCFVLFCVLFFFFWPSPSRRNALAQRLDSRLLKRALSQIQ